ncbi:MAG: SsrA-binding protein SmpB [Phycisphaerae bacterium]|nr:SsrA-binding protein SmpB [Phycisphaerae bacterium]
MGKQPVQHPPHTPRIVNRKARHHFHVLEVVECGLELLGSEVKSLRAGSMQIDDAYARFRGSQVFLVGSTIAPYAQASSLQHSPTRDRKLLLHRRQIALLAAHVAQKGRTLVPLVVYFKRGWAKCELGLAVGKRAYDKRQTLRQRDQQREIDREMRRRRRPE